MKDFLQLHGATTAAEGMTLETLLSVEEQSILSLKTSICEKHSYADLAVLQVSVAQKIRFSLLMLLQVGPGQFCLARRPTAGP